MIIFDLRRIHIEELGLRGADCRGSRALGDGKRGVVAVTMDG